MGRPRRHFLPRKGKLWERRLFATRMDREIEVRQQRGVQLRVERTEKREDNDDVKHDE